MRISFIIPCYNVSKTVRRCLDSIYTLGLLDEEFEVISINDASTDNTLQILLEYAEVHPNMVVMSHLVNRNVGAARNTGLVLAKGNCISFVDSDDEVGLGVLTALKRMEEDDLDMIAMRVEQYSSEAEFVKAKSLQVPDGQVFSGVQFQTEHPFWNSGVCCYLFSRALLERVHYPFAESVFYEDADYLCSHLLYVGKMSYCDECGSRTYANPSSITHTFSYKHACDFAFLGTRMLSLYERLEVKSSPFALTILEGGSWNIKGAFRLLFRLEYLADVRAFYNLLDSRIDRSLLNNYRQPTYCWTWWTRFGVKHRYWMTMLAGIGFLRLVRKLTPSYNPA